MEMTKQDRLTKLLNAYSHHYDIERDVDVEGGHFPATAFYYLRDENYLISKKHVLSAIENYEYIYIDLADHLTAEDLRRVMRPHPSFEEAMAEALDALAAKLG